MSEKKRKPQVIHVEKLIVKADEVIIDHEREHKRDGHWEEKSNNRRDPWGFFRSNEDKVNEVDENEERESPEEDTHKGGFNWF